MMKNDRREETPKIKLEACSHKVIFHRPVSRYSIVLGLCIGAAIHAGFTGSIETFTACFYFSHLTHFAMHLAHRVTD